MGAWLARCTDLSIIEVHEQSWRFSHDKLRECVLGQLQAQDRVKALHQEAAVAIERAYPSWDHDEHLLTVANHLLEAVPLVAPAKALAISQAAARRAMKDLAFTQAVALLEKAMAVTQDSPLSERHRYELLLNMGEAHIRAGTVDRGRDACSKAAELARQLGDPELLARAAITYGYESTMGHHDRILIDLLREAQRAFPSGDYPLQAQVLARLASALQPAEDPQEPVRMAYQAIAMARRLQDSERLRSVLAAAGGALSVFAHPRETMLLNRELRSLACAAQDRLQAHRATARLIFDYLALGEVQAADETMRRSRRFAQTCVYRSISGQS